MLLDDLLTEFSRGFMCARHRILQLERKESFWSAPGRLRDIAPHLFDLDVHLSYSLPPRMYIIRSTELIDLVPQECRYSNRSSRMTGIECRQSIPLCHDRRQIRRELFEIQLFLVAEFDDGLVCLRVLHERVTV